MYMPRRLERALEDVEMGAGKINREAERARAGIVDAFPRAAELSEVRAKRDRLSAELATDSAEETADEAAHAPLPPAANGSHPAQPGRPAIAPPPPPPPPGPDVGPRPPETVGLSR